MYGILSLFLIRPCSLFCTQLYSSVALLQRAPAVGVNVAFIIFYSFQAWKQVLIAKNLFQLTVDLSTIVNEISIFFIVSLWAEPEPPSNIGHCNTAFGGNEFIFLDYSTVWLVSSLFGIKWRTILDGSAQRYPEAHRPAQVGEGEGQHRPPRLRRWVCGFILLKYI